MAAKRSSSSYERIAALDLHEVLKGVKNLRYLLGTTYTLSLAFFESILLPELGRDSLKKCIIICDSFGFARAIDEAPALEGAGQEYIVAVAPPSRCLHAKVWLAIGESEAAILVGSGNLTQSGFLTNAELFDGFRFGSDDALPTGFAANVQSFLSGIENLIRTGVSSLASESIAEIRHVFNQIANRANSGDSHAQFVHSFERPIVDQLPLSADQKHLFVAAPFFGGSLSGLQILAERSPNSLIHVFPAVHSGDTVDLSIDALDRELARTTASRLDTSFKRRAFPHLKLYAGQTAAAGWLFCTSANCTAAALGGENIEAGILRRTQPKAIGKYFVPDRRALPKARLASRSSDSQVSLTFSATDHGSSFSLQMADLSQKHLPLKKVVISARSGNIFGETKVPQLFASGTSERILWSTLEDWTKPRKRAVRIDIAGVDRRDEAIQGSAFLENLLLLTSEPTHRSAWRGALALLDVEGVPDLADISAIFALSHEIFNLTRPPGSQSKQAHGEATQDRLDEPITIWPPEPDLHELHRRMGRTAGGQLRWFQEILKILLRSDRSETIKPELTTQDTSDEDDTNTSETERLRQVERSLSLAERNWYYAMEHYDELLEKLQHLEPTKENASQVWPVAISIFLVVMRLVKKAVDLSPEGVWVNTLDSLIDDFLRVMFVARTQSPDYCVPAYARYREEKFPPLATDLGKIFSYVLHPQLALIVITLFADQKTRQDQDIFHGFWRERLRPIWNIEIDCDDQMIATCLEYWEKFLLSDARRLNPSRFKAALTALCELAPEDH
jgi:hypothetical protein